jgi:hypothetical protein
MRIGPLPGQGSFSERFRKTVVSAFVSVSLLAVLFVNRPPGWIGREEEELDALSPGVSYTARVARWAIEEYAFFAGLNNRWQMFGRQSRFNWWYVVHATYGDGPPVLLPLPGQTRRSVWQAALFDFKETKLNLNLYGDPSARGSYARYLARQYPERNGQPITSVTFELRWQHLLSREEASMRGAHLDPAVWSEVIHTVTFDR